MMMVYVGIVNYGSVGGVPRVQKRTIYKLKNMTTKISIIMVTGNLW